MGNLLKIFSKPNATVATKQTAFVNFENAQPTEEEREVYELITPLLANCGELIDRVKNYPGADAYIKKTIDNPADEEAKEKVWEIIDPMLRNLKQAYRLSEQIKEIMPRILSVLCSGDNSLLKFENYQALSKVFAQILDFSLAFDTAKMQNASLQNDFSYYRRCISRISSNEELRKVIIDNITNEIANTILLFIADPNPYLAILVRSINDYFKDINSAVADNVLNTFARLAELCKLMAETPSLYSRFSHESTKTLCLRVMVGILVLLDHIQPNGIFHKSTRLDIKAYIRLIKEQDAETSESMCRLIRFTSKHFNDINTPASIKTLL